MDSRGSAGPKRARTNGSAGSEGDWTCPQCGNVNFSFRSTCNIRKCGASKPVDSVQRGMGGPFIPSVYDQSSVPRYIGAPGAPPPLSLALPASYGAPMARSPVPSSGLPYGFGVAVNAPSTYNPMAFPSSYGLPGAVIGGGTGYAAGAVVDGYGIGMNMGRAPLMSGPMPVIYPEENGFRKRRGGPDGLSEGDWICPKCGNTNFSFRSTCNMRKCGAPKPTVLTSRHGNGSALKNTDVPSPPGSWTCEQCGNVNYPFRTKCNRKTCAADRPSNLKSSSP